MFLESLRPCLSFAQREPEIRAVFSSSCAMYGLSRQDQITKPFRWHSDFEEGAWTGLPVSFWGAKVDTCYPCISVSVQVSPLSTLELSRELFKNTDAWALSH